MKKRNLKTLITIGTIALTFSTGMAANQTIPDKEITLEGRRPVHFNHKTHLDLGVSCGACHHDADHQPLTTEEIGAMDNTARLKCDSCHDENFENKELRKEKDIFHTNCLTCHREGINGKKGPTGCSSCHTKKKTKTMGIEGC